jgi:arthrofactin-type cyclic lipopeptide synthetase B
VTRTIHGLIEGHAAGRGDAIALVDGELSCSYRQLNAAANVLARRLILAGFRRGRCAQISMPPGIDLAVVLLAILKTGGCYAWTEPGPAAAASIRFDRPGGGVRNLEIGEVARVAVCSGSNLPVITRETDVACMLHERTAGGKAIAVPHATILAMRSCAAGERSTFAGVPGAFDLWVPLMNGATAMVEERPACAA